MAIASRASTSKTPTVPALEAERKSTRSSARIAGQQLQSTSEIKVAHRTDTIRGADNDFGREKKRKRWFLAYVEIPPYPPVRRTISSSTAQTKGKTVKGKKKPVAKKGFRQSRRLRGESLEEEKRTEEKEAKEQEKGRFDWWYDASSPLTEIGSRSASPEAVRVAEVLPGEICPVAPKVDEEEDEKSGARGEALEVRTAAESIMQMITGKSSTEAQYYDTSQATDALKASLMSLVPAPDEDALVRRGIPERINNSASPSSTIVRSTENLQESVGKEFLEETPSPEGSVWDDNVDEAVQLRPVTNVTEAPSVILETRPTSDDQTASYEQSQRRFAIPLVPDRITNSSPMPSTIPSSDVSITSADITYATSCDLAVVPASYEFGGYAAPGLTPGWAMPYDNYGLYSNTGTYGEVQSGRFSIVGQNQHQAFDATGAQAHSTTIPSDSSTFMAPPHIPTNSSLSYQDSPSGSFNSQTLDPSFLPSPAGWSQNPNPPPNPLPSPPPPAAHPWNTPVIPQDWLPNQPYSTALPEMAAQVKNKAKRTRGERKYEFSSFSYHPPKPPPGVSVRLRSSGLVLPPPPAEVSSSAPTGVEPPKKPVEETGLAPVNDPFGFFVNMTADSFAGPGEKAKLFISRSKYHPTGVRWK